MSYCADYSDDSDLPYDCNEQETITCKTCGSRWVDDSGRTEIENCPFCPAED